MAGASRLLGCASLAALGLVLAFVRALASERRLHRRVEALKQELASTAKERLAERTGRIRAQKELREKLAALCNVTQSLNSPAQDTGSCQPGSTGGTGGAAEQRIPRYPLAPIGVLRSCFTSRNGTPRQPLLVGQARAELRLEPTVPPSSLEGLRDFSHCWVLYVFHANTDLPRLWDPLPHAATHAKIRVPRLDGEKRGCLATRTPHRPNPIGLSVAKIEAVEGRTLVLSGADVVDGTPVLDVKPYLPYCDSVTGAVAPPWAQAGDGILAVHHVSFATGLDEQIERCWDQRKSSLFGRWQDLKGLVSEVLSRDIRSTWQRKSPHAANPHAESPHTTSRDAAIPHITSPHPASPFASGPLSPSRPCSDAATAPTSCVASGRLDTHLHSSTLTHTKHTHTLPRATTHVGGDASKGTSAVLEGQAEAEDGLPSRVLQEDSGMVEGRPEDGVVYHVVLDRVDFSYRIRDGSVYVLSAKCA